MATCTAPLPCQRDRFDLPRDVAYFNCAYMSPLLRAAREAGARALARKSQPWTITPADFVDQAQEARRLFAGLVGAHPDDIALVPAVSYAMAVACANLPLRAGQRVLLLDEEFPSVIYAWRARAAEAGAEAVVLPRPPDHDWTRVVLEAIDERTAVAALPVCHWTDGALVDLERIGERLRGVGAALVVDATQSAGAMACDVTRIQPDFLAAAGYKWLLGPYSVSFLYVAPRWHQGRPLEHNWLARQGSEDFAGLTRYRDDFQPGARRFDMGEVSNFALLPVATTSLRQLHDWGLPAIAASLARLTAEIAERAGVLGLTAVPDPLRAPHYLGFRLPGGLPAGLGEQLAQRGVWASVRGSALRVTPYLYNEQQDLDRLQAALEAALA